LSFANKFGNGGYLWQDANDDQIVQASEVTKVRVNLHRLCIGSTTI
jgi:hypothetical protein